MKRAIITVLSIVSVLSASLGITLAYHKAETGVLKNVFTVGNVTTEITEEFSQISETEFKKTPAVTNTGANSCIIRMRMTVTPESLIAQKVKDTAGNDTTQNYLEIGGWSEKWTLKSDGFYYYSEVVEPGETTDPLFTSVTVNYDEAQNTWVDFDIILYQEAVQASLSTRDGSVISDADKVWEVYDDMKVPDTAKSGM